jgi:hypothetical protein
MLGTASEEPRSSRRLEITNLFVDGSAGAAVTSGSKGRSGPPERGQKHTSIAEELHCKRCGEAMTLATLLSKFGEQPRFKLFRCLACDFYDLVKI